MLFNCLKGGSSSAGGSQKSKLGPNHSTSSLWVNKCVRQSR